MKITREDLDSAVKEGVLGADQAAALWSRLERPNSPRQSLDFAHLAYYFGALVVMSAMGWFITLGWEKFGGSGIFVISSVYAVCSLRPDGRCGVATICVFQADSCLRWQCG